MLRIITALVFAFLLSISPASAQWTRLTGSSQFNVDCAIGNDSPLITVAQRLAGTPFLTLPFATQWMYANIDLDGNDLTFQIADNTVDCTKGIVMNGFAVGQATRSNIDGKITFRGNPNNKNAVVIHCGPPYVAAALAAMDAWFYIENLTIRGCYNALETNYQGRIFFRKINFGTVTNAHIQTSVGGYIEAWGNYQIEGGGAAHVASGTNGIVFLKPGVVVSVLNNPNFSLATFFLSNFGMATNLAKWSGTATGTQCSVDLNSVLTGINAPGNPATCFAARGGQISP